MLTLCFLPRPTPGAEVRGSAGTLSPRERQILRERAAAREPLRSLLVHHRGRRIVQYHRRDVSPRDPVNVKSASKSVLSALVGVALGEGHLASLDRTVFEFFPDLLAGAVPAKQNITLRDLLLMRSGLRSTSFERYGAWVTTDHWLKNALNQPLIHPPGTVTDYSTGNSHIVAAILTEATGRDLRGYAQEKLFDPLGVRIHAWQRSPEGYRFGGNNLSLTPGGLLRFGRLYLRDGDWNGRSIVPGEWVRRSTRARVHDTYHGYPYGYYWWKAHHAGFEVTFAWGHGGQFLFIVPGLDLVVVTTSDLHSARGNTDDYTGSIHRLLERVIMEPLAR